MTKDELIEFEAKVAELWEAGELPYLIHLSGGNEDQLIEIFKEVKDGDWIFSTHRNHYHALLAGVPPHRLMRLIRHGDSMFVFDHERKFLSSAILAGHCGIAAGVAWALKAEGSPNKVWCFLGDGAFEEGHFFEAILFSDAHDLPIQFVIEDNDRAVEATKAERRPITAVHLASQYPLRISKGFITTYQPTYPHAGSGSAKHIEFKPRK